MYLVSVFFQDGSIKKFIVQGIVYGISLLFATFMGESQRIKNQKILKQQEDNSKLATELIHAFVKAIDAKDHYLHNHSYNVSYYARLLAKQLKVPRIETERICLAALLHDIGKLDVSGTILNKPGRLTEEEWQIMKVHPERGAEILRCIEELDFLYERIKYHHRNFDGSGYPIDCPIEEVPFDAYIIAVADAFDAMTSDRPYRKALSTEKAYEELKTCAGTQFHPKVVEAFFSAGIVPVENEILHIDLRLILNNVQGGV